MKQSIILTGLMFFIATAAAHAADLRVGTGSSKGNYYKACGQVAMQSKGSGVNVICNTSKGTLDNIRQLKAGEIDAAFVQPDGLLGDVGFEYEIVAQFHPEFVHAIALKEGPDDIKELSEKDTIAIGSNGGGTAITWMNFGIQDKSYSKIPTLPLSGSRALSALESGKVTVVLRVCGLRDGDVMRANNQKGKFKLIPVNDWDFNDKVKGQEIYTFEAIDDDVYKNLISGMFNGSVETIRMETLLIVRTDWADENSDAYDDLYDGSSKAVPNVLRMVRND